MMNPSPVFEKFETFLMVPIHGTGNFANVQFSRKRFNTGMEINRLIHITIAYNDMVAIQRERNKMPKTEFYPDNMFVEYSLTPIIRHAII